MQFLTVLVLVSVCGQSVTEMNKEYCTIWEKLKKQNEQHETSVDNQNTMNLKLDNQSRLIEDLLKNLMNQMTNMTRDNENLMNHMSNMTRDNENLMNQMTAIRQENEESMTTIKHDNENLMKEMTTIRQEYEELRNESKRENHVLVDAIQNVQNDTSKLNTAIEDMMTMNIYWEREIQALTRENQQLIQNNSKLNESLEAVTGLNVDLETENQRLKIDIQKLLTDNSKLNQSVEDLTEVNVNLETENEHLKTESQQLKQENTNLNKSLTDVSDMNGNLAKENELIKTDIRQLKHENLQLNTSLSDTNVTVMKGNLEKENERLETENQLLKQKIIKLTTSYTDVIEFKDNLEKENKLIKTKIQQLKQENAQLNTSLTDVTVMKGNLEKENERLETENQLLKQKIIKLTTSYTGCSPLIQSRCNQSTGTWISGGHKTNKTFSSVFNKVKARNQTHVMYDFTQYTNRMSIVGDKLWVPFRSYHTIRVLDPYTSHNIKMISHPQLRYPWEISQMNCTVIVSSGSGLHLFDVQGEYLCKISGGNFRGLLTRGDVVYVHNITAGNIVTLEYRCGSWGVRDTFPVSGGNVTTIALVSDTLYVCPRNSHTIYTYSLSGTYITKYGSHASKSLGQFYHPYLCGVDNQGSLLACDQFNDRLQVLSQDGTWQVVDLDVGRYPRQIVIDVSGTVWVLSGSLGPYYITRYSV